MAMVTVARDCPVKGRLHEGISLHLHMVWGWRQNLQALTPDTFLSLGNMDDCTTTMLSKKVGGSTTIPVAKSLILLIHSDNLMAVRSMETSTCLSDVPGGGGGIARREHALMICSSPSTNSFITGLKAEAYFFASMRSSKAEGKSFPQLVLPYIISFT